MTKTVEALESAVANLSKSDFSHFSRWYEEFIADRWDRQIEADILAGRLDAASKRADEDFETSRCRPLLNINIPWSGLRNCKSRSIAIRY